MHQDYAKFYQSRITIINPLKQKQMLVTKAQQEAILNKYIKEKHTTDECIGFVDGINATLDLVNKLLTH